MELDVTVQLQHPEWKRVLRPYCKTVRELCYAALLETKLARMDRRFEMTVVLADDACIRGLNRDYRGQDKPTNVLSFPSGEVPPSLTLPPSGRGDVLVPSPACGGGLGRGPLYLGDLVLAYETLEREAHEQDKTMRDHAAHLLVHGVLHLLGYDHMEEKEAQRMEKMEIKILKKQNINNPYL